ncbi:type II toxin-antitoxin system Phd/YefM family antitoxin [Pararhizobium sp.]|uniref:type II toxin-antitoxin system Phd/YefM family antitoxin n=1 Tax=Pararhizobium sp. TaxID=1977563 RepID=UPI00271B85D9|nr:type II toxin-antitoxin system prevent-host-death family antitoxin [Pararhizobium sp.]MDO9414878.1 type II toxin-antitoxin system prevent-host-death family antitoxin [Pararhizobium sp.]
MTTINMLDAKNRLSQLVSAVENGLEDEIVIARNGKPAARLVPISKPNNAGMQLGTLAGKFPPMSLEAFDASNLEIAKLFDPATA